MKKCLSKAQCLIESFQGFDIQQVPRAKNVKADALSKLAVLLSLDLLKDTYLEVLKQSSLKEPQLVQQVEEEELNWIDLLFKYPRHGELP